MAVAVRRGGVASNARAQDTAGERAAAQVAFRRQVQAWIAEQDSGRVWPTVTTDQRGTRHYALPASGKPAPTRWFRALVLRQAGPSWGVGSMWRWWRDLLTGRA